MKKNIFFIGVLVVLFGLIVGLPFAFTEWNKTLVDTTVPLVFYVVSKVIFGVAFIGFGIWAVMKERARGMIYILFAATLFVQLVPLFVRFATSFKGAGQTIYCILMVAIFLIGYIAALGLVLTSNKKMIVADEKYEGSTIEVKDEKVSENRHKGE